MNLQQLITFSTVISEGSMTAAAEKLFLTQPAVSQQIRNLEDELGVGLLDRGVRHARPTMQGQMLYEYAKKIINLTQQAQVAVQTVGEGAKGQLRIGTLNSLGLQVISSATAGFLKHNSKVQAQLIYDDGRKVLQSLRDGELDVAILPDVLSEYGESVDGLDSLPLIKDEMWLVASSKDSSLPTSISVSELATRPFIALNERYTAFEKLLNGELTKAGVTLAPTFQSNNVGTLKRVIEMGLGWGFLPAHSIRKQVRMGRLTAIDVAEVKHSIPIHFYTRKTDGDSSINQIFYKVLKQQTTAS